MGEQATNPAWNLLRMASATFLVVGCPLLLVFALGSSGAISSPLLRVAAGVALSLAASHAGAAYWRRRRGGEDLLFGELLVWGWIGRLRLERSIVSAEKLLEPQARAERLTPAERQRRTRLLERLSRRLETRDPYTHGHSRRVARHSTAVAERMGLPAGEVAKIRSAAAIHDIGKIEVPRRVVEKRGPLDDEEYELIKLHAAAGGRMAATLGDADVAAIVRHHHERLDGNGYPDGLAGEEIPLGARIVAVADTFDALTSERPYRSAAAHREALAVLEAESGTQLDRDVVRAFRRHYAEHPRVALWSLLANGIRQLFQPLVERLGLGAPASAAKAAVVSVAAVSAAGMATSAGSAEAPQREAGPTVAATQPAYLTSLSSSGQASRRSRPAAGSTGGGELSAVTQDGVAPTVAGDSPASAGPSPSSSSGESDPTATTGTQRSPTRDADADAEATPAPTTSDDRVVAAAKGTGSEAVDDASAESPTVAANQPPVEDDTSPDGDLDSNGSPSSTSLRVSGS